VEGWVEVGALDDLRRRRKSVVDINGTAVVLFWHDGRVFALNNICIHRQRELVRGVILGERIVCPGHQWAFNLETGYEESMCQFQPTYDVRVDDGVVYVAGAARSVDRSPQPTPDA
jgi:nitrite reductase (NADH) small subunit